MVNKLTFSSVFIFFKKKEACLIINYDKVKKKIPKILSLIFEHFSIYLSMRSSSFQGDWYRLKNGHNHPAILNVVFFLYESTKYYTRRRGHFKNVIANSSVWLSFVTSLGIFFFWWNCLKCITCTILMSFLLKMFKMGHAEQNDIRKSVYLIWSQDMHPNQNIFITKVCFIFLIFCFLKGWRKYFYSLFVVQGIMSEMLSKQLHYKWVGI